MKKILTTLLLLSTLVAYPCADTYNAIYGIDFDENQFYSNWEIDQHVVDPHEIYFFMDTNSDLLVAMGKETSDLAVAFIYLGKYEKALELSRKLASKYPEEYNVIATYATALELTGDYETALFYLRKAVSIDPSRHQASEWIHIRILEYLIAHKDSRAPVTTSVLGLDFGSDTVPVFKGSYEHTDSLIEQLEFQLEDRGFFVDTTNTLYGSLLFDMANLVSLRCEDRNWDQAIELFEEARRYGFDHPLLPSRLFFCNWNLHNYKAGADIRSRVEYNRVMNARSWREIGNEAIRWSLLSLCFLAIFIPLGIFIRLFWKRH